MQTTGLVPPFLNPAEPQPRPAAPAGAGRALPVAWPAPRGAAPAPADGSRTAVYCLGSFEMVIDGARVETWRPGKTRALLQYLVNHHDRPIPRDTLIGALWPNPDALAAATSLKVAIHALRRALSQVGREGPPVRNGSQERTRADEAASGEAALAIVAHEAGYQLSAPAFWLDVEEFERCCAAGRALEGQERQEEALAHYARAAALYRGDFLADSWDDWVVFRREGLKDQHLFVIARLADAALAAGDYQGCIMRCQELLGQDRCREDTYRTLLLCHARLGQRERVRRWYDLCVRVLRAELGVAPEPETEALYKRAMRGEV